MNSVVSLFLVWSVITLTRGESAGMRLSVTRAALQQINTALLQKEWNSLRGKHLPEARGKDGRVSYSFYNIRMEQLGALSTDISLHDNGLLRWEGHTGVIEVKADWDVKYTVGGGWAKFDVDDDGHVDAGVSNADVTAALSVSYNHGNPSLKLTSCSAALHGFHVGFGGGLVGDILNVFKHVFTDKLRHQLENELCKLLDRSLERLTTDLRKTEMIHDIKMAGMTVKLDNSFTELVLNSQRLTTTHKAVIGSNTLKSESTVTESRLPTTYGEGVTFDISEGTFNSYLQAMTSNKTFDGHFSLPDVKFGDCGKNGCDKIAIHLMLVFPQSKGRFTNSHLGLTSEIQSIAMEIQQDKAYVNVNGRLTVTADSKNGKKEDFFSGKMDFVIPYQVKFSDYKITGRPTGVRGTFTIDRSNAGSFEVWRLETVLGMAQALVLKQIKETANTEYVIKRPAGMTFTDAKVKLYPGVVRLETNLCYHGNCDEKFQDAWVGENSGVEDNEIRVIDETKGSRRHDEF